MDHETALERLYEARQRIAELEAGLRKILEMNLLEAEHRYGDRARAEEWACVKVARAALAKTDAA